MRTNWDSNVTRADFAKIATQGFVSVRIILQEPVLFNGLQQ